MRAQRVVRRDAGGHLVRVLRAHAIIDVLPPVGVGPAVEAAFLNRCQVVRHQVFAQFVAFVDYRPQLTGFRLYRHCGGVAQAGGVGFVGAGFGVDLPDHGAVDLGFHAAFGDVAVGADADIQVLAIGADGQRLGPVVIDLGRQVRNLGRCAAGLGLAVLIVEANEFVLVGDI